MNLPEIDVYDALGDQPDSFIDGVHPNSQGASVIANEVYNSMDSINDLNQTS
jgi:lysophospholipase L1-like esterase